MKYIKQKKQCSFLGKLRNVLDNIYLNHIKCTHLLATLYTVDIIITDTLKNNMGIIDDGMRIMGKHHGKF